MIKKKYIPVIPGNIKGADDTRTDILTLLGITVDPMSNPEINNGRMSEPVAALLIDGKMYDLKSVLTAFAGQIVPVAIDDPQDGDILVYDAESGKFINVATEES